MDTPNSWIDDHRKALGVDSLKGLTPKHNRPTVWIDTETTGFGGPRHYSSGKRQILDVCAIKLAPGATAPDVYESKVRMQPMAERHAQAKALEIVGYDPDEWADAPPLQEVLAELVQFISGSMLVGHGLEADWRSFILPSLTPYWIPEPNCFPLVCTEMLARAMIPNLSKYTLAALCEHYGIPPEDHHRARGGAERCQQIYQRLTAPAT